MILRILPVFICLFFAGPAVFGAEPSLDYERLLSEGSSQLQRRRYQDALAKFDLALKAKPNSAHAMSLKARALQNLKRKQEAQLLLKAAMAADPKSIQPYLSLASFSLREKQFEKARQYLAQAERLQPGSYEVAGVTGSLLLSEKKYKEALPYFNEAIAKHPDAFRYAQRAVTYRLLKDKKNELKDYERAIALSPKSAEYATERATTLLNDGKLQQALTEVNRALSLDDKYALAYYIRANVELKLLQRPLAMADINKAIALEDAGGFRYFRALLFEQVRDFDKALKDLQIADEVSPNQAHIKAELCRVYHRLLDPKAALAVISEAIKLEPKNSEYYDLRSHVYRTMMEFELAAQDDGKSIEYAVKPPVNALVNRVRYYRLKSKYDLALKDQNRLVSCFPDRVGLREQRAQIYEEMGDYRRAKEDIDAVLKEFPTDANYSLRARVNLKLKKYAEALSDINKAIVMQPGMSTHYVLRAEIHEAAGNKKEAQKDRASAKAADQAAMPPH
jgi:tetratricopeptide (TPR) repeat protein